MARFHKPVFTSPFSQERRAMFNDRSYYQTARTLIGKVYELAEVSGSDDAAISNAAYYTFSRATNPEHAGMLPELQFEKKDQNSLFDFLCKAEDVSENPPEGDVSLKAHRLILSFKETLADEFDAKNFAPNPEKTRIPSDAHYDACVGIYHSHHILSAARKWGQKEADTIRQVGHALKNRPV